MPPGLRNCLFGGGPYPLRGGLLAEKLGGGPNLLGGGPNLLGGRFG